MAEIFHITTRADWERAVAEGSYRADSLATEGFIHASTAGQVAGSANRFFRGATGLVVLRIDLDRVASPIRLGEPRRTRTSRSRTSTARSTSTRWSRWSRSSRTGGGCSAGRLSRAAPRDSRAPIPSCIGPGGA